MRSTQVVPLTGAFLIAFLTAANGQSFSDNFDAGTSAGSWTAILSHADASANFAFNYSSIGIPSAPNSGGTTIGMRFLANQSAGVQQGISASPNGQSFTGDFRLRFDMWLNYNGPVGAQPNPPGGSGSTQVGSFGWGTSGAAVQWAGSSSSIMFGATGDGGSTFDYRVYTNNSLVLPATGVYAAGTGTSPDARNNVHPYYTSLFGGEAAPAAQVALYPGQTGVTDAGALGFDWRDVIVDKVGNTITWTVDGNLLGTVSTTGASLSGNNIFFGIFDINATSSTDVNDDLITAIYDNIRVTPVPEPGCFTLALLGAGALLLRRRR
jgi:hypothetical protein